MENIDYTIGDLITPVDLNFRNKGCIPPKIKEGDVFEALELRKCPCGCNSILVDIGLKAEIEIMTCGKSGKLYLNNTGAWYILAKRFKKLDNLVSTQMEEIEEILKTPIFENL